MKPDPPSADNSDAYAEDTTHAFVIRIWLDVPADDGHPAWRGHITHVPDGKRVYFADIAEITTFVGSYLGQYSRPPPS